VNFKVTISYDGKNYHGWAKQPGISTVQETIEVILSKILDQEIKANIAGRTDAFVHAHNQVFSFSVKEIKMDCAELKNALNSLLPKDIEVKKVELVNEKFHARYSAKKKVYIYRIYQGEHKVFNNDYSLVYENKINLALLKKAAHKIVGTHNFLSFSLSELEDTTRTVYSIKFKKAKDNIYITFTGNGFLRGMIRMIVGTFIDINEGKKNISDIDKLFTNPKKGSSITKARASGLYLEKVIY
jgi:tRNA pseudouridine38-40 synthase